MSGRCGFTLVELLIAIAIVVIALGVGVPYVLVNLPTYRVNGASRQLVADLRLAKTMAVEKGTDVLVQFDPLAGTYAMAYDTNGNDALDAPPTDEPIKAVDLPAEYSGIEFAQYTGGLNPSGAPLPDDGVSFDGNLAVFHPTGGAAPGAVYVRPARDAGARSTRERGVTVIATTGRARAYRWNGTAWE